ncbi:alpha/beta hydrolase [Burkholderia sp. Ac-20384]|uniref:alpha/beta fold hydrolase n=1 Tax=Burkholderia sp. Ac-20384 TaxID=2703902 RepID=UPI0019824EBB|nr:alpha/beta hydrolase [Burkholderia sp. Ac-20384]MBN3823792.1 alpha/beta hydrolase [Burkholderia sp. Ac-20384]
MHKHDVVRMTTQYGVEYFAENGNDHRLLVFVHGWRDSASGWQWVINGLNSNGEWKIVAVQRHAVERNDSDSAALLDDYASQVLDAIADATGPESEIVLVGQSMGAAIAELAAIQLADRLQGLVLITPAPLAGSPMPPETRDAFELGARDLDRVNAGLGRVGLAVNITADAQLRMILATPAESERSTLQTLASWIGGHPAGQQPSPVEAPTLLLVTEDQAFPEQMLREQVAPRFANILVEKIHGAGHFPHLEQPEEVAKVINGFISGL